MKQLKPMAKSELSARVKEIWGKLLYTKSCYKFCHRLYFPASEREAEFLSFDQAMGFLRITLFRTTVLELAKLFSRPSSRDQSREKKVCIFHLIDMLSKAGQYANSGISTQQLEAWKLVLTSKRQQIDSLLTLRDEVIAHHGDDKIKNTASFADLRVLLDLSEDILGKVYDTIFESSVYVHEADFEESINNLLECVVKPHAERIEILQAEMRRLEG